MDWILSSKRLGFRKISMEDFDKACEILQDIEVMYAWEHAFSDAEVKDWIGKNILRYETHGFSYFAVIERASGEFIGLMGPLVEDIDGTQRMGIGYIFNKKYWGKGYAIEGARACVEYAFSTLKAHEVIAEIRPDNLPSRRLAQKLGMTVEGEFVKRYNGIDMPHLIYCLHSSSLCFSE